MGAYEGPTNFLNVGASPSLMLNFAREKSLTDQISGKDLVTFTRSSTGTYVGADGLIKTASADEPRFDHDANGNCLGLLIEESRTNYYTTSETMTGGRVSPSPSQWTWTSFDEGGPQGGSFMRWERIAPAAQPEWNYEISYSSIGLSLNDPFVVSFYARCPNGTLSSIKLTNPDAEAQVFNITSEWQRFTAYFTYGVQSGYTFFRINRGHTPSYVVGSTYDIAGLQIENKSFPTSYIPTSGSTVTRSADTAQITNVNYAFPCTIYGEYETFVNQYARRLFEIIPPSATENTSIRPLLNTNGTIYAFSSYTSSVVLVTTNSVTPYSPFKVALALGRTGTSYTTDKLILENGNISESGTSTLTDTYFTNIRLGNSTIGDDPRQWCGHINRFIVYDNYLTDIKLQQMTKVFS